VSSGIQDTLANIDQRVTGTSEGWSGMTFSNAGGSQYNATGGSQYNNTGSGNQFSGGTFSGNMTFGR
jgi:hypothetical protein